jgi:hypothetical protein
VIAQHGQTPNRVMATKNPAHHAFRYEQRGVSQEMRVLDF